MSILQPFTRGGRSLLIACCIALLLVAPAQAERARYDRTAVSGKLFTDVVLDLEYSIGRHNFAVVGHNEIGDAVRRRGHPDFGDAAIVHFCNIEYARQVMNIDRTYILYMPCRIAVFEQGDRIHAASLLLPVDTDRPAFNTLAHKINRQIREIVDYAVSRNEPPSPSSDDSSPASG